MKSRNTLLAFLVALTISAIWTYFNRYEYVGNNVYLFNTMNVFPLVLWTLGLTALYVIHTSMKTRYPFFHTVVLYLVSLSIIEAVGYHLLNIRLNSNYPSLLGLGIVHGPFHMKVFYVIAGPVYILLVDFLLLRFNSATRMRADSR